MIRVAALGLAALLAWPPVVAAASFALGPQERTSVLIAFPGVDDQIEVYDPSPQRALAAALSGKVRPVG